MSENTGIIVNGESYQIHSLTNPDGKVENIYRQESVAGCLQFGITSCVFTAIREENWDRLSAFLESDQFFPSPSQTQLFYGHDLRNQVKGLNGIEELSAGAIQMVCKTVNKGFDSHNHFNDHILRVALMDCYPIWEKLLNGSDEEKSYLSTKINTQLDLAAKALWRCCTEMEVPKDHSVYDGMPIEFEVGFFDPLALKNKNFLPYTLKELIPLLVPEGVSYIERHEDQWNLSTYYSEGVFSI